MYRLNDDCIIFTSGFHRKNCLFYFSKYSDHIYILNHLKLSFQVIKKITIIRSSRPKVFCKKAVLRDFAKFTRKHLCQSLFLKKFIKKETLAQVFSLEFYEISRNTVFSRTHQVTPSRL